MTVAYLPLTETEYLAMTEAEYLAMEEGTAAAGAGYPDTFAWIFGWWNSPPTTEVCRRKRGADEDERRDHYLLAEDERRDHYLLAEDERRDRVVNANCT